MYILIDRERMALLHKHSDVDVLANVAWIECHNAPYSIFPVDDTTGFKDFTDMELKILYRNITGQDDHTFSRPQVLQVIYDLCSRISESDINAFEVDRQAEYIKEGDERRWLYVKGASRPAQQADLFEPQCRQALRNEVEEQNAMAGKLPALKRAAPVATPRTGQDRPGVSVQQPVKVRSGPKRGTAKAIIWQTADKMWEDSGKPTDKETVLSLRKDIMVHLETEEGIKRASSSSELGQWHKARAPY
jgi:hypothetical protein